MGCRCRASCRGRIRHDSAHTGKLRVLLGRLVKPCLDLRDQLHSLLLLAENATDRQSHHFPWHAVINEAAILGPWPGSRGILAVPLRYTDRLDSEREYVVVVAQADGRYSLGRLGDLGRAVPVFNRDREISCRRGVRREGVRAPWVPQAAIALQATRSNVMTRHRLEDRWELRRRESRGIVTG